MTVKKRKAPFQSNKHLPAVILLIALSGILFASTNTGHWLEEEAGLAWLFWLRGPLPAPDDVVVVSIDHTSSKRLGLENTPRKWPRSLHAKLVNQLSKYGAEVIIFDIIFEEERVAQDNEQFAQAIREAGNVILFQSLEKTPLNYASMHQHNLQASYIETLNPPTAVLSDAALGLAPFPLPKSAASVNHFITYIPEMGDIPTLPVVALEAYAQPYSDSLKFLLKERLTMNFDLTGGIQYKTRALRRAFLRDPQLVESLHSQLESTPPDAITAKARKVLLALSNSYALADSVYVNLYGPPQTITTIPYYRFFEEETQEQLLQLKGRAVFVGYSEQFQPEQQDNFYTAYSRPHSGLDISGVEIAATAFDNLLNRNLLHVTSSASDAVVYVAWAVLLCLILQVISIKLLFPCVFFLVVGYHQVVYELFQQLNYWIPLTTPLLWQTPLAILAILYIKYLDVHHKGQNIRHALDQHLPGTVVDKLVKDVSHITSSHERVYGIVLASDAQQYTLLSERLSPVELHQLMNRYYEALFEPIRNSGGLITDVVGDAAIATWTSTAPDRNNRQYACNAALEIQRRIDSFNNRNSAYALPTRLGLHYGELSLGHVGAIDHYEYRAVGDIVNTASRIEGLNKLMGTRILASKEVLEGLVNCYSRRLGEFMLLGKSQPLSIYEIIAVEDEAMTYAGFTSALDAFYDKQWHVAGKRFEGFIKQYGEDGPSRFYLGLCKNYQALPPKDWDGVIRIDKK